MKPEKHFDTKRSIVQEVVDPLFQAANARLFIKRDDLIHHHVSGNKWRKLKFNVLKCVEKKNDGILTFGGAYSNHLLATAAACNELGVDSIGIVRGDELTADSNETLKRCHNLGMKLIFVSRQEYGLRNEKFYQDDLSMSYPNYWLVPEGGANYYGVIGCQEILSEVEIPFDEVFVAQGTTTTSLGIAMSLSENAFLNVVPALKGYEAKQEMKALMHKSGFEQEFVDDLLSRVKVLDDFHFGGYGKYSDELLSFIHDFYVNHNVKLDPVYTGKVMYALFEMVKQEGMKDKTILFIHTGGVQGSQSIIDKSGFDFYEKANS